MLFDKPADYEAFKSPLEGTLVKQPIGSDAIGGCPVTGIWSSGRKGTVTWPRRWIDLVNAPQTDVELESLRLSVTRGRPYGSACFEISPFRRSAHSLSLHS